MDSRSTSGALVLVIVATLATHVDGTTDTSAMQNIPVPGVNAFSWETCGGDVVAVQSLSIFPDPITFPGTITIGAKLEIKSTIEGHLEVSLTMKKKILRTWIQIPCVHNIGSCTYDDLCSGLSSLTDCPPWITALGLTCHCPFKNGNYGIESVSFDIDYFDFASGDYSLKGNLYDEGKLAACLQIFFTIG